MSTHAHHHAVPVESKLRYGIIIALVILAVEISGGLLSNSLALLSDAGHVFVDVVALSLSWYGVRQVRRPPSSRMTFGYHRIGVIIAIVNAVSIFAIAGIVFYEAYNRFRQPPEVNSLLMLSVAVVGLGANILVAYWLRGEQKENLNVRSAFWHALGDALASIGVILGGIIILFTGWFIADPIVSVAIGIIILIAAWQIFREGIRVLLEATPPGIDVLNMVNELKRIPGIKDIHDVHVWSISPEIHAMSCHALIDDLSVSQAAEIRKKIEQVLTKQFHIEHSTIQMECQQCDASEMFCTLNAGDSCEKVEGSAADEHK